MPSGGAGQCSGWLTETVVFVVAQVPAWWSWASGGPRGGTRPPSAPGRGRGGVPQASLASGSVSAWDTRRLKVLATRRYPGPAFDELGDVEIGQLEPRHGVEALIVANEPV